MSMPVPEREAFQGALMQAMADAWTAEEAKEGRVAGVTCGIKVYRAIIATGNMTNDGRLWNAEVTLNRKYAGTRITLRCEKPIEPAPPPPVKRYRKRMTLKPEPNDLEMRRVFGQDREWEK